MSEPATDDLLARLDNQLRGIPDEEVECITVKVMRSFIARIRAEQAEVLRIHHDKVDHFEARLLAERQRDEILSLLVALYRECECGADPFEKENITGRLLINRIKPLLPPVTGEETK